MSDPLDWFRGVLVEATAAIDRPYFLLPVANAEGAEPLEQYRERVYAYELYHQLRNRWPDGCPYSLGGEIDKSGHPIVHGGHLDHAKPDLLVHIPGTMAHNLVVIEIKPLKPDMPPPERRRLKRDLLKLIAFREIGYAAAIMMVFGDPVERVRNYGDELRHSGAPLHLIELWHHRKPGEPADRVGW